MRILTLGEEQIKAALSTQFREVEVEREDGGIGVTSYISETGLIWTRCMDGLDGGWDVYDPDLGASSIVILEPWEVRIVTMV